MLVQVDQVIMGYDGDPFMEVDPDANTKTPITIRWVIRGALNTPTADGWTPETLLRCATLSKAVHDKDSCDLSHEDRTFIQERAAKVYAHAPYGPMSYAALVEALADPPPADDATREPGDG